MKTELFDYDLPDSQIARHPTQERDGGRLLVLDGDSIEHDSVRNIGERIPTGALLVLNDTRVRRARLLGQRAAQAERGAQPELGGRVELLLLEQRGRLADGRELWHALGRASKPLRVGAKVRVEILEAEVIGRLAENGVLELAISAPAEVEATLERIGRVPIPPYLTRDEEPLDRERYQTVYAARTGSVAAPTAGLHFTPQILARLAERGVFCERLELEVGLGTFRPVSVEDLDHHAMHEERFIVTTRLVDAVAAARTRGAPVVALGTTVVRALESAADPQQPGRLRATDERTRLLIQPGYRFQVVDALFTNFHQPRSTLLALVAAFAGHERILQAYRVALAEGYRFLSYGDAMWIPRRA